MAEKKSPFNRVPGDTVTGDLAHLKGLMVNDNGFAFDPVTGLTYVVSPTGADIIHWVNDGLATDRVVARLQDEYDVDEHTATRDFETFISSLRRNSLI